MQFALCKTGLVYKQDYKYWPCVKCVNKIIFIKSAK